MGNVAETAPDPAVEPNPHGAAEPRVGSRGLRHGVVRSLRSFAAAAPDAAEWIFAFCCARIWPGANSEETIPIEFKELLYRVPTIKDLASVHLRHQHY